MFGGRLPSRGGGERPAASPTHTRPTLRRREAFVNSGWEEPFQNAFGSDFFSNSCVRQATCAWRSPRRPVLPLAFQQRHPCWVLVRVSACSTLYGIHTGSQVPVPGTRYQGTRYPGNCVVLYTVTLTNCNDQYTGTGYSTGYSVSVFCFCFCSTPELL